MLRVLDEGSCARVYDERRNDVEPTARLRDNYGLGLISPLPLYMRTLIVSIRETLVLVCVSTSVVRCRRATLRFMSLENVALYSLNMNKFAHWCE